MPLRWSSHRTSSCTELEGRIISCFRTAIWQRVSCPSTLSVAMHFLSARIRISRLLGVSMRQLQSGSSWASSMADIEMSAGRQSLNYLPLYQFKFVSVKLSEGHWPVDKLLSHYFGMYIFQSYFSFKNKCVFQQNCILSPTRTRQTSFVFLSKHKQWPFLVLSALNTFWLLASIEVWYPSDRHNK